MSIEHNPLVTAECESEFSTLILGNHDWRVTNDFGCDSGGEIIKRLSFSSCTSWQYTCTDGLCVDLGGRCDGKIDCEDKSDEVDCMLLEDSLTYNKQLPPPGLGNNSMVEIDMSIDVINLGQIDEIKSSVDFQYVISLSWYEGRRMFQNLQDSRINQLNTKEVESLWIPKIVLYNTETRQKTIVDEDAIVSVSRKGNYTELKNRRLFEGTMNPLSLSRFYKTRYICNFNMAWYPFDTQVCSMEFVMVESIRDIVDIVIGNLTKTWLLMLEKCLHA